MTLVSDETIDLQTAARQLGVHYQTAYRWVRSGELRATMVMGSYRLEPDVVARFSARRARPVRPRTRRPRTGLAMLSQRLYGHLVAGEEPQAGRLIGGLAETGVTVTAIAQDVLVPALRHIGEEWRAGRVDISAEHRASAIVERILAGHYPKPRGRRRGTAAVAALSGDRHALPTTLAAICLREDNWLVHHLGADLPTDELMRFCHRQHIDLVVLTVTVIELRAAATRTAEQLHALGLRALVGGPGRSLDELQHLARHERQHHSTADSKQEGDPDGTLHGNRRHPPPPR
jgi:excisionase family DNA binding protein